MLDLNIELPGVADLQKHMEKKGKNIAPALNAIIKKSLYTIERNEVRETATFKQPTGRLAGSIREGIEIGNLYGSIGPTVKYAKWVNYGHAQQVGRYVPAIHRRLVRSFVPGNPFVQRGIEASKPDIKEITQQGIHEALDT